MKDKLELPTEEKPIFVMAYALINYQNDYTPLGSGTLEIVTDTDMVQSQHYIEVTDLTINKDIFLRSRLQSSNVYERQKNTVIMWNDPEQNLSNLLGISFQDDAICDRVWRLICSKIGKNYLEINGCEKLEMPNEKNILTLHQKIKTSYNLVAYHAINSKIFMNALLQTLQKLDKKEARLRGIQILRDLFSNFDPKLMETFLSDPNFQKFLSFFQKQSKINFASYYKKLEKVKRVIDISKSAEDHIELAMRAKFMKEGVINYSTDRMMQGVLSQVIKDHQIEAIIDILQTDSITRMIYVYQNSKSLPEKERKQVSRKIIRFFLQAVLIIQAYHVDITKFVFLDSFYCSGMFRVIGDMIRDGESKVLEILSCLAQLDIQLFYNELTNDYRNNSSSNLIKLICKQFSENSSSDFANETINFLKSLNQIFIKDKSLFEFINKTMILSIFSSCKHLNRTLLLTFCCFTELNAIKFVSQHIVKYNFFQALSENMRMRKLHKNDILTIVKIIRFMVEVNNPKMVGYTYEQVCMLNSLAIQSGLFRQVVQYLKMNMEHNNLLTSSILNILDIISTLKFNEFTHFIQMFDFGDLSNPQFKVFNKLLLAIHQIKSDHQIKNDDDIKGFDAVRKRCHRQRLEEEEQENYLQQVLAESRESNEEMQRQEYCWQQSKMQMELFEMKEQIKRTNDEDEDMEIRRVFNKQKHHQNIRFDIGDIVQQQ